MTVSFGDADDRDYSEGRRACTSRGNTISVTFDAVVYMASHPSEPLLCCLGGGGIAWTWDYEGRFVVTKADLSDRGAGPKPTAVCYRRDGRGILVGTSNGSLKALDPRTLTDVQTMRFGKDAVTALACADDEECSYAAAADAGGCVAVFKLHGPIAAPASEEVSASITQEEEVLQQSDDDYGEDSYEDDYGDEFDDFDDEDAGFSQDLNIEDYLKKIFAAADGDGNGEISTQEAVRAVKADAEFAAMLGFDAAIQVKRSDYTKDQLEMALDALDTDEIGRASCRERV